MPARRSSRWAAPLLTWWAGTLLFVGAVLLGRHVVALPKPARNAQVARAFAELRQPADQGRWLAVHVLYAGCGCSARVVDHLIGSPPAPSATLRELVLWVGHDPQVEGRLSGAGFRLLTLEPEALRDRFQVDAAPVMIVLDEHDRIRHVGGYTARKQGPDIQDRKILAALLRGESPDENPVLGCAVSGPLKAALDPLGLP
jgi:hypothetical protein